MTETLAKGLIGGFVVKKYFRLMDDLMPIHAACLSLVSYTRKRQQTTSSRLLRALKHNLTLILPQGQFRRRVNFTRDRIAIFLFFPAFFPFFFPFFFVFWNDSLFAKCFRGPDAFSEDAFKRAILTPRCSTRTEILYSTRFGRLSATANSTIDNCNTAKIFFYYFLNKCGSEDCTTYFFWIIFFRPPAPPQIQSVS